MRLPLYQVDAFAEPPLRGNPAAVCPLGAWLPDESLQAIAEENNLSETAFLVPDDVGYHLRWFTPTTEVSLCGHATLASAYVAFRYLDAPGDRVAFTSQSGRLDVTLDGDRLTLDFPAFDVRECDPPPALVEGLGAAPTACYLGRHYLVVYEREADVRAIEPDFRRLAAVDGGDVMITAPGADAEIDFVSRYFAPNHGIDEDPVTGSAHSTAAPYWAKALGKPRLVAIQASRRGGALRCEVRGERVLISGKVHPYLEGSIVVDAP